MNHICFISQSSQSSLHVGASERLRIGVPFRAGAISDPSQLLLRSDEGSLVDAQWHGLAWWPDGSLRWGLLFATPSGRGKLEVLADSRNPIAPNINRNASGDLRWDISEGSHGIRLVAWNGIAGRLNVRGRWNNANYRFRPSAIVAGWDGPVFTSWSIEGKFLDEGNQASQVLVRMELDAWHAIGCMGAKVTITNPQPADHPNGNWDLGNPGSMDIEDLSLELELESSSGDSGDSGVSIQRDIGESFLNGARTIDLFQSSSGGEHWNGRNHLDRHRKVPMQKRGYVLDIDGMRTEGLRVSPVACLRRGKQMLAIGIPKFWQNFPRAIRLHGSCAEVGFFPREAGYAHELQGGEQKTHECAIGFFASSVDHKVIESCLRVGCPALDCDYVSSTGVIPFISAYHRQEGNDNDQSAYELLVRQAIEGGDTFATKREQIDEYGWRNFGDVYGDHEAVYHQGPELLVSHYNNQYDCTAGFAYQYLRSGEPIWYDYMVELADHAWDIDTYHTERDKAMYNMGLFWHTYHYADADTGTHRSYPRSLATQDHFQSGKDLDALGKTGAKLKSVYGKGGGPAASHNYATGWVYAYYLTGEARYRAAAINAADYVIDIEDGLKTPFRWAYRGPTGHATGSSPGYYGPGRASANSTLALLAGYELTEDPKYLDFAVDLMKRTVHPKQDLEKLDLLNAELRWFYTMYLQALVRLVAVLSRDPKRRVEFAYGQASLMHYCRWMVEREHPILDHPERLQYPTETWAAQDIRKWHVLAEGSLWCPDPDWSKRMKEKAEFFFSHSVQQLNSFETKSLCRPVVLMMNYGWQRLRLKDAEPLCEVGQFDSSQFGEPQQFRPQRQIAISRAKRLFVALVCSFVALTLLGIVWWIQSRSV
jgi:hypothetical protein